MAAKGANPYVVLPVMKALRVLELVTSRGTDVSLTVVSRELAIPKTTTFRYLQTLSEAGFLSHDVTSDKYGVGPRFRMIAKADTSLHSLRTHARPVMVELVDEFNETVNLAIEGQGHVVYVDIVEANRSLRMQARIGERHPMHSTALGKAILAHLPAGEREAYFARPLTERTGRTLIERPEIERQLRQVTKLGYATETGENEDGAMCIGAPILDDTGYPIAAVSLSAPLQRMPRDLAAKAGEKLLLAARRMSARLSGEPS